MDLVIKNSQALSPIKSPQNSIFNSPLHSNSHTGFPIIAIAIIGILATALLLVSYYIFVIKCCLNWHRIDILRRFSLSRNRNNQDPLMVYSPPVTENRGLNESVIRSIPIFQFKKEEKKKLIGERSFCECSVCLNEFQENEKLRMIPNCCHVFHIDCIDVWLQRNDNCPLCRTSISSSTPPPGAGGPPPQFPLIQSINSSSSSPQNSRPPYSDNFHGRDEDFVVIELGEPNNANQSLFRFQERSNSGELSMSSTILNKKSKKFKHVSIMGDEFIDVREKDDQFAIQPIRRSFSMDSASDRQLYLAVQEILQKNSHHVNEISSVEDCSNRVRRSFFSFGHGRGSRSAVLPIDLEP